MKGSKQTGQLLDRVLSHLLPDVFFHPVWTHFVEAETPLAPQRIQLLLDTADAMLSAGNTGDACRILFICAFQQLRAGDYTDASSNIQRILILAEQHGLSQVAWWATWGAAAVCVRRGWFQQAAGHLEHLQSILGQQHEWVLSDAIDVLRQALLSQAQAEVAVAGQMLLSDAVLSSTFRQLQQWGVPLAAQEIVDSSSVGCGHMSNPATSPSRAAGFNRRPLWQKVKGIVKGELRLKFVESEKPAQVSGVDRNSSLVLDPPLLSQQPFVVNVISETSMLPKACAESESVPGDVAPADKSEGGHDATSTVADMDRSDSAAGPRPTPSLTVYTLGSFHLAVNDMLTNRSISGKSKTVFTYLLAHHDQAVPRDVLMDVFWPDAGPEAARNRLNFAMHRVRQALRGMTDVPVMLYEDGAYSINPEFDLWIDADEFERHVRKGRQLDALGQAMAAMKEYELACDLYQGDFMTDEPYEDWPILTRERLRVAHLDILDRLSQICFEHEQYAACEAYCQQILVRDNCREDVHCRLMQCYSRQNQRCLALRQYQNCIDALRSELDVDPAPATTQLYERVRRRERV